MKVHVSMRSSLLPVLVIAFWYCASTYAAPELTSPQEKNEQGSDDRHDVRAWFQRYDRIRKEAQMTFPEKLQAAHLLNRGLSRLKGESELSYARSFIKTMIDRYERAERDLSALPEVSQTHELQQGYEKYFHEARTFFGDYMSFQEQQLENDNTTHQSLVDEKEKLTALDKQNKELDAKLRHQYHIARFGHIFDD